MAIPAIIYAALSEDDEAGNDSTADQVAAVRKRLAELCDRAVVGKPHIDHASGFRGNRGPSLEAALAAAIDVAPCELWVFHSSRLTRGSGERDEARSLMELLVRLRRQDVTVRSVEDDAVLASPAFWGMAEIMAHKYSADLSAHVRKGKRAAFEQGKWPGARYVPDGYALAEGGGLVIDEARAPVVRRAAELVLEGLTFNATARALTAEGYLTKDGKPWRGVRIKEMLSHPIYAGRVVWHYREPDQEVRDGLHEAIIDPDTWERLGAKMGMRNRGSRGGRPSATTVLSGLAVCARCGEPMFGRRSPYVRKDGSRQIVYRCAARQHKTGICDMPALDAERIDAAVVAHLNELFIDFEAWVKEQTEANQRKCAAIEAEAKAAQMVLKDRKRERDTARKRYMGKQTDAREDALEHTLAQVKAAEARVSEVAAKVAAVPTEPSTDALLDAFNELKRVIESDKQPLNTRLKQLFAGFQLDTKDDHFLVLPVLRPDVIEQHADPPGAVKVVSGDDAKLIAPPEHEDTSASPVMRIVPPPSKALEVPLAQTDRSAIE